MVLVEKVVDGNFRAFRKMTTNHGCYGHKILNTHFKCKLDEF